MKMLLCVQGVMQIERRLGGSLLDKPRQMLFTFNAGSNLCVSIEEFGAGWRCKQAANYQVRFNQNILQQQIMFGNVNLIIRNSGFFTSIGKNVAQCNYSL